LYVQEITQSGLLPKEPFVQCGTLCCKDLFFQDLVAFASTSKSVCKTVSIHSYPLSVCGGNTVTLDQLMEDWAGPNRVQSFKQLAIEINSLGIPLVIGETNSVSCHGAAGVSDVFGAALWALDWLFNFASLNVQAVNFHGGIGHYTAIFYNDVSQLTPDVRPLYYGMYMFALATKRNSVLIDAPFTATDPLIKVWLLHDQDTSAVRVVVIHKNIHSTVAANITVFLDRTLYANYDTVGSVIRLTAPSPYSVKQITVAGLTFDGTLDGKPIGHYSAEQVTSDLRGTFSLQISPASAAMFEVIPHQIGAAKEASLSMNPTFTGAHYGLQQHSFESCKASWTETITRAIFNSYSTSTAASTMKASIAAMLLFVV